MALSDFIGFVQGSDPVTDLTCHCPSCAAAENKEPAPQALAAPGGPAVQMVDDFAGDTTTLGRIAVNGSVTGSLEVEGDEDWFRVTLSQGDVIEVALDGAGDAPLSDPLLKLFNADGVFLASDDDGGVGLNSRFTYTVQTTGDYFVAADAFSNQTGDYRLSLSTQAPSDVLEAIDWGTRVQGDEVAVYFAPSGTVIEDLRSEGFSSDQIDLAMQALSTFTDIIDLTFTTTTVRADADFTVMAVFGLDGAFFIPPGERFAGVGAFDPFLFEDRGGFSTPGSLGFDFMLHEFGHGLGLAHPHDEGGASEILQGVTASRGSFGIADLNQAAYTVMTYNNGLSRPDIGAPSAFSGHAMTPMALDIAVLQQKYGANKTHNSGDDIYLLPDSDGDGVGYSSIWDTGGHDAVVYEGAQDAAIDLRSATLKPAIGGGGWLSYATGSPGGFTIARGARIEDAYGGSGIDAIRGNSLANRLDGGRGADFLNGGGGDDVLIGGRGRDRLDGGQGADIASYEFAASAVIASLSNAMLNSGEATGDAYQAIEGLRGGAFDDRLIGAIRAETLSGGEGDDDLRGLKGRDVLYGGAGDDRLRGGEGVDALYGGGGSDIASYHGAAGQVLVSLRDQHRNTGEALGDTLTGIEGIAGTGLDDRLYGDAKSNHLRGLGGDDLLAGYGGDDHLSGGRGDDRLRGGDGADLLDGGAGRDRAIYASAATGVTVNLADASANTGEAAGDVHVSVEDVSGSANDDRLMGDAGRNRLDGRAGADEIYGGDGRDMLSGDAGDDVLNGGAQGDEILGGRGRDTADYSDAEAGVTADLANAAANTGDAAGDVYVSVERVSGSGFDDTLSGDDTANRLSGRDGADTLSGRAGVDTIYGGDGDDTLQGGAGDDRLFGGAGFDIASYEDAGAVIVDLALGSDISTGDMLESIEGLTGSSAADDLSGDDGGNLLAGGDGGDLLRGRAGDDALFGGGGDDLLIGGLGDDMMTGGGGADEFQVGFGRDEIADFKQGVDLVRSNDAGFSALNLTDQGDGLWLVEGAGWSALVSVDPGGTLGETDFVFV